MQRHIYDEMRIRVIYYNVCRQYTHNVSFVRFKNFLSSKCERLIDTTESDTQIQHYVGLVSTINFRTN